MNIPTKLGTSTYHPTMDWVKQNLSFNQLSPHHIPNINTGYNGIKKTKQNEGFHRLSHLNPQPQ